MPKILPEDVQQYIRNLIPPRDELLSFMEKTAAEKVVPIVEPEVAQLLYWLALSHKCSRVLEIGTGIGYSTLWLAKAVIPVGGKITTIEINKPRYDTACENFRRAGLVENIELIFGDAREILFDLSGPYDLIFLDAAKGKYLEFLEKCVDILQPGGILAAEDVFMRGMVISGEIDKRRNKTAVSRLKDYLERIIQHPQLETTIIPMGDGIALSLKKQNEINNRSVTGR
ncbi:O-methyltransferase family 3 [Desulfofarcimen acetoxidans DSM 771]|uniref:tRNA 5-hydroxyuridine methyltransferase n=1 Tax=Desulfofarcimen acetoxidans (strain ATCC 49208 / DSM 771 / KCTC 5769 / VKM B-1644 / 5575) TaxID=485916 RepID=C8W1W7_DESAS|nr:O-methyltransferase [Desulfofarcimen acetoxidans]ACV63588.1 O-methyltransferase family 3 [Desulfofarcimen acetoxidans DSM 771]